ncbi:mitochondrial inner membrane protease atp23-like [Hordeum vulgare subsp. vulgare]|uniref:Mitochondrial inner membrane protease ATP23 n=1 Tax=Hordeum vulgare subsp. vulgare TaxID=112509 RepID=F2CYI6_HORVV|nr:mitochondrial inner membrane protease atp23-like [Hordeum vulgare subsp. vulgare]KAI5014576.1 hypothetical protein ZWY2020_055966 [Hordeum vulgare]BAJ87907.1 predicted protein [Hordeum vulgare subsp. vulgare]
MAAAAGDGGSVPPKSPTAEAPPASQPRLTPNTMPWERCVAGVQSALKDPLARFLREQIEKAGCTVWPTLIRAAICTASGGYTSGKGIEVCCNHMRKQDEITQVIIHELVHAYDDCVVKNINWNNCAHHACSEIRANHLSGNCHYKRELMKGFLKIKGHEPECVKRRALLSVQNNPSCRGKAAKEAVENVWDTCYNDPRPFDKAP